MDSNILSVSYCSFNINALKIEGKNEIIRILNDVPGKKSLVIDPNLSRSLNLISEGAAIFKVLISLNVRKEK